ncbi:phosphotransferase [Methylomonas paludis]|uniref:Phosphotransferase n=1 Tax=Methylomonas paludis TaxID=1173101 RepID=A0A975MMI1_9GAMM|nr:phosphotransferase [Methylomonas paludis]QWF70618.1 phosphotransferase [Methylomonas paludis]
MSVNKNIVVRHPKQLTPEWAQTIIGQFSPSAKVSAVDIQSVNLGTTTRLQVYVEHDATDILPREWFVKTPSLLLKSRLITALPRLLHKEVQFYKALADSSPVRVPEVLAAQTRFGRGSTLVMANLTAAGYRPGQTSDALTLLQASQVVEHLAQFHAHYWHNTGLLDQHSWLSGFNASAENHLGSLLAVPLMQRGLKLAGADIPAALHKPALFYAANRRRIMHELAAAPLTLVHHDCHPGNLFWTDSGPGFLDWQLVRMGEGISDIAYFLATALKPELRRDNEQALLALYLQTLTQLGIGDLDEVKLYQRYRAHLSYPFEAMVVTLAIGNMMEDGSNRELIRRAAAAVADHDSFAALGYRAVSD